LKKERMMKKLGMFALVLGFGMTFMGCEPPKAPPAPAPAPPAADAAPADGAAAPAGEEKPAEAPAEESK
jgi:hypothetical protein